MANTTNLNIRVDTELKRQAEAIFNELGLNLSSAMNIFLRQAVRYRGIPFELRLGDEPLMGEAYLLEMRRRVKEIESGKVTLHELIEVLEDE